MENNSLFNKKEGFTLAELLVVVAIIAILVAVSIPIFLNKVDKAKESTCAANRRALKAAMTTESMDESTIFKSGHTYTEAEISAMELKKDFDFDDNNFCPSGGTITVKYNGSGFTVYCSEHNKDNKSKGNISDSLSKIIDIIAEVGGGTVLDSEAVNDGTSYALKVINALKKEGIDLNELGANSWRYSDNMFYWSPKDISKYNTGDTFPVMRYNTQTGTYTVWNYKVRNATTVRGTYNAIYPNGSQDVESKNLDAANQTYDNAWKIYQKYL